MVGLALVLGLAACGSGNDDVESGTEQVDGAALVVYSGRNENLVAPLLEQFTADTGIDVSVRYADTATLAAQLLEEGERTDADVFFSQDAGALGALADGGRLADLPQATLDSVEARFRSADGAWVGVSGRARVLDYNPTLVPEADLPAGVAALTEPRWEGQVAIAPTNASFQSFVTAMRRLTGDEATRAWLSGLVANDVQIFDNNIAILDAVDKGVVAVGLSNHYYWYERAAEVGADAMTVRLHWFAGGDPGALVNVAGAGILAGSDRAEDAQQLVDYLLAEKAQTYFAEETKEYPLSAGVQPVEGLPALSEIQSPDIDLSDLDDLAGTLAMLQEVGLT
jgi:iron(III) transport system substrate-binding protein